MSEQINRRRFFRKSLLASAAAASAISLEEKALLARAGTPRKIPSGSVKGLPAGKIGNVKISRLICGGNLIGGYAHSRDLIYVSELLKHYFTDEKIFQTFEICEANGINTVIAGSGSAELLKKYWDERGGQIQWIAQCVPKADDLTSDVKKAVDGGAVGAFVIGNVGDQWARAGRTNLIGRVVDFIKKQGVIAGVGGHNLGTPMACEKAGIEPDFYMKTHHSTNYWSKRSPEQNKDAYKVLAAGAIHPRDGFRFAFGNGADFVCVGMFDFQVREDVIIARKVFSEGIKRPRPWMA
jgi:hypothetical protein